MTDAKRLTVKPYAIFDEAVEDVLRDHPERDRVEEAVQLARIIAFSPTRRSGGRDRMFGLYVGSCAAAADEVPVKEWSIIDFEVGLDHEFGPEIEG